MITSTKMINNEIFAVIAFLIFNLSSREVLLIKSKDKRNC